MKIYKDYMDEIKAPEALLEKTKEKMKAAEALQTGNSAERLRIPDTAEDMQVKSIAEDMQVKNTAEDMQVKSTAEDMQVKSTANDLQTETTAENMHPGKARKTSTADFRRKPHRMYYLAGAAAAACLALCLAAGVFAPSGDAFSQLNWPVVADGSTRGIEGSGAETDTGISTDAGAEADSGISADAGAEPDTVISADAETRPVIPEALQPAALFPDCELAREEADGDTVSFYLRSGDAVIVYRVCASADIIPAQLLQQPAQEFDGCPFYLGLSADERTRCVALECDGLWLLITAKDLPAESTEEMLTRLAGIR